MAADRDNQGPVSGQASVEPRRGSADIRERVRQGYATIAREGQWSGVAPTAPATASSCCSGGGCCGPATMTAADVAKAVGYTDAELGAIPEGANLGLSCGNPAALAELKSGEVVMDLGSGAGFDCFIAGPRVGAEGRVIGVDMTSDMLARARERLGEYAARTGLNNVEFRLGEIEHLPAADASVDVVISNCVLNLSPDKPRVWREIARVLKPGGRVAISDLALLRPLPEGVRADVEALVGCVAGATMIGVLEKQARDAGLRDVLVVRKPGYVDAMVNAADPLYVKVLSHLPAGAKVGDYVASVEISAQR